MQTPVSIPSYCFGAFPHAETTSKDSTAHNLSPTIGFPCINHIILMCEATMMECDPCSQCYSKIVSWDSEFFQLSNGWNDVNRTLERLSSSYVKCNLVQVVISPTNGAVM